MKKEDLIYYGLLFAAGVGVALFFRKEYNNLKKSAISQKGPRAFSSIGIRG